MDRSSWLLYSYVVAAKRYAATKDPGYKKTLGMFRQRLHAMGIRVISLEEDEMGTVVHMTVNGHNEVTRLTTPR